MWVPETEFTSSAEQKMNVKSWGVASPTVMIDVLILVPMQPIPFTSFSLIVEHHQEIWTMIKKITKKKKI